MKELKDIDNYIYETLVLLLLKMVPEYGDVFDQNYSIKDLPDGGIYLFMNEFTVYLSDEIKKDVSSNFVKNSFMYINAVGDRHNLELLNILKVGILEILYTENALDRNRLGEMLNENLAKDFNAFSKYYS